ncbi:hypothetical protein RCL_jg11155.t1 [Rhizophagus clarus]|uniref:Uncharacterized protein n=1 Tax=Rhizophagus clarus TaxID=94130 RepID=A0A8H3MEY9_9GLOM|nr:hypothetical protein RCL_jg11155.t1 [Rhizophagus clarus]
MQYRLKDHSPTSRQTRFTNELDKNNTLDGKNVDDEIQSSGKNEESDSDDDYLINSSSESKEENFNDNKTDDSDDNSIK